MSHIVDQYEYWVRIGNRLFHQKHVSRSFFVVSIRGRARPSVGQSVTLSLFGLLEAT